MSELAGAPRLQRSDVVWTDGHSGLQTVRNVLEVDRGMTFQARRPPPLPLPSGNPTPFYPAPAHGHTQ